MKLLTLTETVLVRAVVQATPFDAARPMDAAMYLPPRPKDARHLACSARDNGDGTVTVEQQYTRDLTPPAD